jgi:hypothetical protein
MHLLILSPHRDDAAFSLSLALEHWLRGRHTLTIVNVFTRSRYAPFSDADTVHENDLMSYVSAMRKREDEAFLKQMRGARMVDLNLKDAPIRLRCDAATVCDIAVNPDDGRGSRQGRAGAAAGARKPHRPPRRARCLPAAHPRPSVRLL